MLLKLFYNLITSILKFLKQNKHFTLKMDLAVRDGSVSSN